MAKTADRFLAGLKRRIVLPSQQKLMEDTDMLAICDDVIASYMVPLLLSVRQDFFVYIDESKTTAAGQKAYSMPYRAIARGLRDLKLVSGDSVRDVPLIASEDEHIYIDTGNPHSFYFRGDKIVIVPTPQDDSYTLQQWYNMAPSSLVKEDQAAEVISVNNDDVTVNAVPSGITTGSVIDFIQGKSGNSILSIDQSITNIAGSVISFGTDVVPDDLVAGDYISIQQTSPVVMLPDESYPLLETACAIRVLNMIGDFEGAGRLKEDKAQEEKSLKIMLEPRISGENTLIINHRGLVRARRHRYKRRGLYY